jgi:hypothetical protein
VFHNPVKDTDGPNRAWAADITYIRTDEWFLYLSLITDMWSRKTVGCHAGDTPGAGEAVKAPGMAPAQLPEGGASRPPFGQGLPVLFAFVCREAPGAGAGGKLDLRKRAVTKTPLPSG